MIHVRNLTKFYHDLSDGRFVALDGVSFDCMPGQIMGLVGPNGAGKTTALRILATVLEPTSGIAQINGFDVAQQPDQVRRCLGFVSLNTAIYDRLTAWEMVHLFGRLHGMDPVRLEDRMAFLFDRFQMNDLRNTLGSKMCTGMKQKVSIARALIHDPPVLIFDEATSGLDILVAREVLKTIEQLRDQGKCILFSSHIMTEVRRLCDHVAIINHGRILACGAAEELTAHYGHSHLDDVFYDVLTEDNRRFAESVGGPA